jgi:hypothetical protein
MTISQTPVSAVERKRDILGLPKAYRDLRRAQIGQRITSVLMRLGTSPTGMTARTFMA